MRGSANIKFLNFHFLFFVTADVGDIRLVGGTLDHEGRVEIQYQNQWWAICDDAWDLQDANVICKQLGYTRGAERESIR